MMPFATAQGYGANIPAPCYLYSSLEMSSFAVMKVE